MTSYEVKKKIQSFFAGERWAGLQSSLEKLHVIEAEGTIYVFLPDKLYRIAGIKSQISGLLADSHKKLNLSIVRQSGEGFQHIDASTLEKVIWATFRISSRVLIIESALKKNLYVSILSSEFNEDVRKQIVHWAEAIFESINGKKPIVSLLDEEFVSDTAILEALYRSAPASSAMVATELSCNGKGKLLPQEIVRRLEQLRRRELVQRLSSSEYCLTIRGLVKVPATSANIARRIAAIKGLDKSL